MSFHLISQFQPKGDQPQAIKKLIGGLDENLKDQVLLGVTGSGKTYTMASVIAKTDLPTLIISPNKTLAAQLYQEFKNFFPSNAVHYFVSFYDYYQPEAYLPLTQTYIQKDARINLDIDKLRHAAIQSVLSRPDAIVIASVSCIYGLGSPENYRKARLKMRVGQIINEKDIERHLQFLRYEKARPNQEPALGQFALLNYLHDRRITLVKVHLVTDEKLEIEIKKRRIKTIQLVNDQLSTVKSQTLLDIYPAKFWVTPQHLFNLSLRNIKTEMEERMDELQAAGKFEEADRLERRTLFDLQMLKKKGYVHGIENYSRHLDFRQPGEPPLTLLDYFPRPFLLFIDESHIAIPQLRAMQESDRRRKQTLVNYGFRLPSAFDNRPLAFKEFNQRIGQTICVSATPGSYELERGRVAEQLVRPTGILDPKIIVRPAVSQVANLIEEITKRVRNNERVLALTLTKRASENLTEFLLARGIRANYMHSEIKTLQRPKILNQLRRGDVDVLVGINLLREGLDLPEVSLVAILDADREGFLRNHRSLMQMAGRASRSIKGEVILYADFLTDSIKKTITETERRRKIQARYNKKLGIIPASIIKKLHEPHLSDIV